MYILLVFIFLDFGHDVKENRKGKTDEKRYLFAMQFAYHLPSPTFLILTVKSDFTVAKADIIHTMNNAIKLDYSNMDEIKEI